MVNVCAVCNRSSEDNPNKYSFFSIPSENFEKYCEILKIPLKKSSKICQRHFPPHSYKSNFTATTSEGVVIYKVN